MNNKSNNLRATVCKYSKTPDLIDFVEVVVHTGEGEIIDFRVWESDPDMGSSTDDEIVAFTSRYGVTEIRTVPEVLVPVAACGCCGERLHAMITDDASVMPKTSLFFARYQHQFEG
jgi:bacterioferritin-associated ferredoxin